MGYESRIYVVNKTNILEEHGKFYAQEIAKLNLCKCGDFCDVFQKETDSYIYADDGNTPIFADKYDEPLKEASLDDVIAWLQEKINSGNDYRRFNVALALLKSFQTDQWGQGDNIVVLHYGY